MMSSSGGATRLEPKRFRGRLSWVLVLGALLLWGIGCGVQNPSPGCGQEFAPNLRWASGDASPLLRNAHYLKLIGQPALALKELEEAHRLYPDNMKVVDALAHSYDELGMGKRAQQVYQEALARESDNPVLLNNLGFSYYLAGNLHQAETCFRKVLDRHPNNQPARNNLGLLLCRQGHREEARQLWQEAEGEAVAAQKIRQALAVLGTAGDIRYARQPKVEPGTRPAPPSGEAAVTNLAATLAPPPKAPASHSRETPAPKPHEARVTTASSSAHQTDFNIAGHWPDQPLQPRRARAAAPLTPVPAPKIATAAKPGKADLRRLVASQPDRKGVAGETFQKKPGVDRPKYLTARELMETNIAILNGNGTPDLAHEIRSRLSLEGFNVADIGNYRDFGVALTVIYYRPDSEHVAMFLNKRFFPGAEVEPAPQLADRIDVKVILGHDLFRQQHAEASQVRPGKSFKSQAARKLQAVRPHNIIPN